MLINKIKAINTDKYYDIITTGTEDNPTFYYKPKTSPNTIKYIMINGAVIQADNPHIIVDKNTVKIMPYELNQEHVIEIDGIYTTNVLANVSIRIEDVFVFKRRIVSTIINISKTVLN